MVMLKQTHGGVGRFRSSRYLVGEYLSSDPKVALKYSRQKEIGKEGWYNMRVIPATPRPSTRLFNGRCFKACWICFPKLVVFLMLQRVGPHLEGHPQHAGGPGGVRVFVLARPPAVGISL